jgi:acyl-homoserine-lactone acylase
LESFRGIHAIKVLKDKTDFTLEGLIAAAYDPLLTGFELMIPPLLESYQSIPKTSTSKNTKLDSAITLLGYWDYKYSKTSFETTLAVFWAQELMTNLREKNLGEALDIYDYMTNYASVEERIDALSGAIALLEADFGSWQVAWGEVNRYQRINGDIIQKFDDNAPSLAVGFASSRWGSLASFGSRRYEGTKKMYGTSGNSFVAFVEFGDTIRAKSILAGGISGDPSSPHFDDQAQMYADEQFKEVLFYEADIKKNAKKTYQP